MRGTLGAHGNGAIDLVSQIARGRSGRGFRGSSSGNRLWTKQWGSNREDAGGAVVTTSSGAVFVAGVTSGDLGGPTAGSTDAFVTLFEPAAGE